MTISPLAPTADRDAADSGAGPDAAPGDDPLAPEDPAPSADPDETEPAQNPS